AAGEAAAPDAAGPATETVTADGTPAATAGAAADRSGAQRVIVAAIDGSPVASLVTEAAARLATATGQPVDVVHAQEPAVAGDTAADGESRAAARSAVAGQLAQLAARGIPATGHVLLRATGHGSAGRLVAEHANRVGASTIVIGAPARGGIPALMDASASRELWRHARSHVLIVNPQAVPARVAATAN
ncbi:MAG: universal stress protein, partial [Nocardiopsaceae bacterium]|nr:universal stress protein [Nocardiopsaceae bacterium]